MTENEMIHAIEDSPLVVWDDQGSWLDDFDFGDYTVDEPTDRVGGLWNRYGGSVDTASRIVSAQRLVQGFVDTFATGDLRHAVTFDESIKTAGTDYDRRKIIVSHRPLFDPTLTFDEANTVLTAMACHEACHVRYGRRTVAAAKVLVAQDPRAATLSNILDDVRIEQRFVADYPGYSGIFASAIKYIAEATVGVGGLFDPATVSGVDIVSPAIRYAEYVAWTPESIGERDWWLDWAARGTRTDKPADHVRGLQEGLAHLDAQPSESGGVIRARRVREPSEPGGPLEPVE